MDLNSTLTAVLEPGTRSDLGHKVSVLAVPPVQTAAQRDAFYGAAAQIAAAQAFTGQDHQQAELPEGGHQDSSAAFVAMMARMHREGQLVPQVRYWCCPGVLAINSRLKSLFVGVKPKSSQ
jgi:hypothetical protein